MKKKLLLLLALAALCAVLLCACGQCEHDWKEANCDTPKTCRLCDETDGAPLGHEWYAATCENAKTCAACGHTDGEALGHQWADATCEAPKTCTACRTTEGEALGHAFPDYMDCENPPKCAACGASSAEPTEHSWVEANCDTAKTCSVCAATTGAPLGHEWYVATCDTPKTCAACGKVEGQAKGHSWVDATCETAKVCSTCGKTEGAALGHNWVDATCEAAKTCGTCGKVEGEAQGHSWVDATTEAPKTCTTCGATEGDKIVADSRFNTAACQELFGRWIASSDSSYTSESGVTAYVHCDSSMTFGGDGSCKVIDAFDLEQYKAYMQLYLEDYVYLYYAELGYSKDAIDTAMINQYGVDVPGYVASSVNAYTQEDATKVYDYVYYVEDGIVYLGSDWTADFGVWTYVLADDSLTLTSLDGTVLDLTRA